MDEEHSQNDARDDTERLFDPAELPHYWRQLARGGRVTFPNQITLTLALLPRNEDGSLRAMIELVKPEGKIDPHRVEPPCARPHHLPDRCGQGKAGNHGD
jgi:hypothetical protein